MAAGCTVGLLCKHAPFSSVINLFPLLLLVLPLTPPDGLGGYRLQKGEPYGVELSLVASVVLGGSSIPRAIRLRKPVPIALSVLSTLGLVVFGDGLWRGV